MHGNYLHVPWTIVSYKVIKHEEQQQNSFAKASPSRVPLTGTRQRTRAVFSLIGYVTPVSTLILFLRILFEVSSSSFLFFPRTSPQFLLRCQNTRGKRTRFNWLDSYYRTLHIITRMCEIGTMHTISTLSSDSLNPEVCLWSRASGGRDPPEAIGCCIFEIWKLFLNGLFSMSGLFLPNWSLRRVWGVVGATL